MLTQGMTGFIEKVTNDEAFRELVIENPADVLAQWDLSDEEMESIKRAHAWKWLRELWKTPPGW